MKRLIGILISILTAFAALCGVSAADSADAYIENGGLVIEYRDGMSETAVAAYYSGQTLCGSYISKTDGKTYNFVMPEGYTRIRVWFIDTDETLTVHIIDRSAFTPSPIPSAMPTEAPVQSALPEEPTEEPDEGYGGFLEATAAPSAEPENDGDNEEIQTFIFSVECSNALSSSALDDDLREQLPSDGIIAPADDYELTDGMTVYDALMAAADKYGFEVNDKAGYVSAIGALGEFDCGPFSGWMYLVNGKSVLAPMSGYVIEEGDTVCVAYTCSLGNDLGQEVDLEE